MGAVRRYWRVALVAFLAALAAILLVRVLFHPRPAEGGELHELMHHQLDLDPAQERRIAALEARFGQRRAQLSQALDQANAQLAEAMASEHEYGPRVAQAVDRSHMAMGELQKETLAHVFAMRAVLRPDQAAEFDRQIAAALTATPER